ncbi:hypothetical protein [Sphingomonas sp. 10B4]|uniref:hypothetical protein n=1 Tax=Sphingomonas sp. 10B4 TaxID=3048575 RepID=UPI002AB5177D|nr:hypothetical protein [Sphingomonas sp. 10B4]MDY7524309.1 hypothetical protein [Sphingomonas sp. 10B4]MEB0282225.1 hypothetical protein [Sphingomonas sp. 10B4]
MILEGMLISLSVLSGLIILNIYRRVLLFLNDRKIKNIASKRVRTDAPRETNRQTEFDGNRDPR